MNTVFKPYRQKLHIKDQKKLFKTQLALLLSPTYIQRHRLKYPRHIERLHLFIPLIMFPLYFSFTLLFVSKATLEKFTWVFMVLATLFAFNLIKHVIFYLINQAKLRPYKQEIEKAEYLVTQGFIRHASLIPQHEALQLQIDSLDLQQQIQSQSFVIHPIQLLHYNDEGNVLLSKSISLPKFSHIELLLGQKVELCLLPESHLLIQIRIIESEAQQKQIWQHQLHKNAVVWHNHSAGIPHQHSPYALSNVESIHAMKTEEGFELTFQCMEQDNFSISNQLMNFQEIEPSLPHIFKGFDQSTYNAFKQNPDLKSMQLWHTPQPINTMLQKQQQEQKLQLSTGFGFLALLIGFVVICQHSIG